MSSKNKKSGAQRRQAMKKQSKEAKLTSSNQVVKNDQIDQDEEQISADLKGQAPDPATQAQMIKIPLVESSRASKAQFTDTEKTTFHALYTPLLTHIPSEYQEVVEENLLFMFRQGQLLEQPVWQDQIKAILAEFNLRKKQVKPLSEQWPKFPAFQAIGYKVQSRGPDDLAYKKNPILQEILPRGILFVKQVQATKEADNNNTKEDKDSLTESTSQLTIFAPPKFYGFRSGDDDDNQWSTSVHPEAKSFLLTEKANGENAQIYWYTPAQAWIIGSKNRKILAKNADDLAHYKDGMYQYSVNIGRVFFNHLKTLSAEQLDYLQRFLTLTKLTMIFEIENTETQHVVPLFEDRLVLVTMTSIYMQKGNHPALTYALSKLLGFTSVVQDMTTYHMDQLDRICDQTSHLWESEGRVMYLLNERRHPVQLLKTKSYWYILLRAIREKLRSNLRFGDPGRCKTQMGNRLRTIKKDMSVPDSYILPFIEYGKGFADWFFTTLSHEQRTERIGRDYPILWREFLIANDLPLDNSLLNYSNQQKKMSSKPKKQADPDPLPETSKSTEQPSKPDKQKQPALLVLFQGVPGIGKNFLGEQLLKVFPKALVVAQDDFVKKHGSKNSGEACFKFIEEKIYSGEHDLVFLARNNASRRQYQKYLKFPRYLFIAPQEVQERPNELLWTCMGSLLVRKASEEEHPTDELSEAGIASLPLKFFKEFSYHPLAYKVPFLAKDFLLPKEKQNLIQDEMKRYRKAKNPWEAEDVSEATLTSLGLSVNQKENIMKTRRPVEELVSEVAEIVNLGMFNPVPRAGSYSAVLLHSADPLQSLLEQYPAGKQIAHHVTLMHSNNFQENPDAWFSQATLQDTAVKVLVVSYKHYPGHLLAARVHLFLANDRDECVNSWVYSGLPHVTLKLEGKTPAFESFKVLGDETIPETILKTSIWLDGHVEILDS